MEDAIRAYAAGAPPPDPTLPRDRRLFFDAELRRIVKGRTPSREVSEIVAEIRRTKEAFRESMQEALERTLAELKQENVTEERLRALTFEGYWTVGAAPWAVVLPERLGVAAACRDRGLDGLLDVRAVRLEVGASLSLVFSQVIGGRKPQLGDGYDQWHAVQASAVDVFVTRDKRLADHLARVPITGFRAVTSFQELLSEPAPADTR